ncbi:YidC/Oxa1 family membrane protein insertase, partial [Lactococcus petauri]|nr:YidC/Oxa1 family membrane protein insertase [Lactococcus petauri]
MAITEAVPAHNLALAIVIFTIIIKFILFPLSKRAVVTQMKMKLIEPEMAVIKAKYKGDRK